jgi:transposase
MPKPLSSLADIPDPIKLRSGVFSAAYTKRLCRENARLQVERQAWQVERQAWQKEKIAVTQAAIHDRQQAGYFKSMHERALERLLEKDQQIEALKAKVAELTHRVFGRKSEIGKSKSTTPPQAKRPRGQQPGTPGHSRKPRKDLPVVEIELDLPADQILCACCNKPWVPCGEPETSETIEWEVHLFRRRTKRNKYRRPDGCTCDDRRPDIVCAPIPPALIPNGLLGISFIVQALLLKFLDLVPMHRILEMAARANMPLSAGTLCGVFEKIPPLLLPLYEGIKARSRQEDLALMDETRWQIFIDEPGKTGHRWWLWVVVTKMTKLYILSPSRSGETPKEYFGYDAQTGTIDFHKQLMVDRYKAYEFLKNLLALAYCWAHVRRDFLDASRDDKHCQWAEDWMAHIGELYALNKARLALACKSDAPRQLPAPFVELDPERMQTPAYQQADQCLRQAVAKMDETRRAELASAGLRLPRRKVLQSLEAHWHGLTIFVDQPQIPMDNNGAERAARPAAVARKNYYGSGSKWSGDLLAMLMTLLQTLRLHRIDPRAYLTAYLDACANHGSKAPDDITRWLPWNFVPPEPPVARDPPQGDQPLGPTP